MNFFKFGRIVELDQKHEAIELRFGQRIGSFLLDRVLRGQHQERRIELERFADRGHFVFLHRLEHGGLRFWRGAVDFVGQHDVGEHRAMDELKFAAAAGCILQNVGAGDVHRHQVGRELDAAEFQRHRFGQFADEQRFGQARHAHQQGMAAGKQADRKLFDDPVLADDDAGQLGASRSWVSRS